MATARGALALMRNAKAKAALRAPPWGVSEQWSKQTPLVDSIIASADAHEGSLAFTEKRAPEWQGK